MKKILLGLALVIGLGLTSCKKDKDGVENVQPKVDSITNPTSQQITYNIQIMSIYRHSQNYYCYLNSVLLDDSLFVQNFPQVIKVHPGDILDIDKDDQYINPSTITFSYDLEIRIFVVSTDTLNNTVFGLIKKYPFEYGHKHYQYIFPTY